MKKLILTTFTYFISISAQAVVDLDSPILFGRTDKVFYAKEDRSWAYLIPFRLERLTKNVDVKEVGDYYTARFQVGVPQTAIEILEAALKKAGFDKVKIRGYRAISAEIVQDSTSIELGFEPKLTSMAEANNIFGPTEYALSIKSWSRFLRRNKALELFDYLFNGCNDHVGSVRYQFNAKLNGQDYLANTLVPILVGSHEGCGHSMEMNTLAGSNDVFVLHDKDSNCWQSLVHGKICLRDVK